MRLLGWSSRCAARPNSWVADLVSNNLEDGALAFLHGCHAIRPALNHTRANGEFKGIPAVAGGVKLGSIEKGADVVAPKTRMPQSTAGTHVSSMSAACHKAQQAPMQGYVCYIYVCVCVRERERAREREREREKERAAAAAHEGRQTRTARNQPFRSDCCKQMHVSLCTDKRCVCVCVVCACV